MLRAEDFLISFVVAEAGAEAGFLGACGLRDERNETHSIGRQLDDLLRSLALRNALT